MSNLNSGKASALSKMWNKYRTLDEVVSRSGLPRADVVAFLSKRPGYPGPLHKLNSSKKQREKPVFVQAPRPSIGVTLPTLSFMGQKPFDPEPITTSKGKD